MRLLLVEDDEALRTEIHQSLDAANYVVDVAENGEDGAHLGETCSYDAIILDLGLPIIDGISILADWRKKGVGTPIMILTARDSWRDKVRGLRTGADDYLAKPFQTEELLARLEALIRRSHGVALSVLTLQSVQIDLSMKTVSRDGRPVQLTPNEYRTLAYLGLNRSRVISKTELTEHLYDQDFDFDSNVIEALVARLRKKLGGDLIKTRRGHGYVVE
jgi:two-component system OmpR family response regulator